MSCVNSFDDKYYKKYLKYKNKYIILKQIKGGDLEKFEFTLYIFNPTKNISNDILKHIHDMQPNDINNENTQTKHIQNKLNSEIAGLIKNCDGDYLLKGIIVQTKEKNTMITPTLNMVKYKISEYDFNLYIEFLKKIKLYIKIKEDKKNNEREINELSQVIMDYSNKQDKINKKYISDSLGSDSSQKGGLFDKKFDGLEFSFPQNEGIEWQDIINKSPIKFDIFKKIKLNKLDKFKNVDDFTFGDIYSFFNKPINNNDYFNTEIKYILIKKKIMGTFKKDIYDIYHNITTKDNSIEDSNKNSINNSSSKKYSIDHSSPNKKNNNTSSHTPIKTSHNTNIFKRSPTQSPKKKSSQNEKSNNFINQRNKYVDSNYDEEDDVEEEGDEEGYDEEEYRYNDRQEKLEIDGRTYILETKSPSYRRNSSKNNIYNDNRKKSISKRIKSIPKFVLRKITPNSRKKR
jgi:hypothetical protein